MQVRSPRSDEGRREVGSFGSSVGGGVARRGRHGRHRLPGGCWGVTRMLVSGGVCQGPTLKDWVRRAPLLHSAAASPPVLQHRCERDQERDPADEDGPPCPGRPRDQEEHRQDAEDDGDPLLLLPRHTNLFQEPSSLPTGEPTLLGHDARKHMGGCNGTGLSGDICRRRFWAVGGQSGSAAIGGFESCDRPGLWVAMSARPGRSRRSLADCALGALTLQGLGTGSTGLRGREACGESLLSAPVRGVGPFWRPLDANK